MDQTMTPKESPNVTFTPEEVKTISETKLDLVFLNLQSNFKSTKELTMKTDKTHLKLQKLIEQEYEEKLAKYKE
jgi:hypothetical protein